MTVVSVATVVTVVTVLTVVTVVTVVTVGTVVTVVTQKHFAPKKSFLFVYQTTFLSQKKSFFLPINFFSPQKLFAAKNSQLKL